MSYLALARKWRPKNFSEMVGQEHVLRALINALDTDRLHHAFLFTGTRGVGKTTIARILAKSINCEQGVSSQPCGQCSTCIEVDEGRFVDLIEVDAASRTRVEDTRELLDNVQYAPSRGRYKVYLIDEVHMLSASSFNALLKTLEEPPPHVKFLFATTDPQKLPVTILSRCLQFNLRRLSVERISDYLQSLLDKENISYEAAACKQLAIAADGSMRDGLSLLDQAIAYSAGSINIADVTAMLGSFDQTLIIELVDKLVAQDAAAVMQTLVKISEQVPDLNGVLQSVLNVLHAIALYQQVPQVCETMFDEQGLSLTAINDFSKRLDAAQTQLYYQIGLTGQRDLNLAPSPRSGLEMVLLRMLAFTPSELATANTPGSVSGNGALKKQQQQAETVEAQPQIPAESKPQQTNVPHNPEALKPLTNTEVLEPVNPAYQSQQAEPVAAVSNKPVTIDSPWHEIAAALPIGGMDKQAANQCILTGISGNTIELALTPASAPMLNKERETRIQQALTEVLNTNIQLTINMQDVEGESPAAREQRLQKEKIANAEAIIEDDANVKSLLDAFDGYVQPDSVQPVE